MFSILEGRMPKFDLTFENNNGFSIQNTQSPKSCYHKNGFSLPSMSHKRNWDHLVQRQRIRNSISECKPTLTGTDKNFWAIFQNQAHIT